MSILLTKEERDKAWEDTFKEPISFDHKPTAEELFDLRLEAVEKALLKKIAGFIGGVFSEKKWEELLKEIE